MMEKAKHFCSNYDGSAATVNYKELKTREEVEEEKEIESGKEGRKIRKRN
jgi:hypothetical protein